MATLFWSADYQRHWIAYTVEAGYVVFPAEEGGWLKRVAVEGLDPRRIRPVPAYLAFNTGFPMEEVETQSAATAA